MFEENKIVFKKYLFRIKNIQRNTPIDKIQLQYLRIAAWGTYVGMYGQMKIELRQNIYIITIINVYLDRV